MSSEALDRAKKELTDEGWLTLPNKAEAAFYGGLRTAVTDALALPKWKGKYITADDCAALVRDVRRLLQKRGLKAGFQITVSKGKLEFTVKEASNAE